MKAKVKKYAKVAAIVGLVGFMLNTLLMLGQLKGLDSQLSTNSRLLSRAIAYEEAMGVKSASIQTMADQFDAILKKMETARALAKGIAGDAEQIRQMNDALLSTNREIDGVIIDNFDLATQIASRMTSVVGVMGGAGDLLTAIGASARRQLTKVAQMYDLACQNNAALPALP
jgi:hypothetical protein